jgi:proteasome accessory factor C
MIHQHKILRVLQLIVALQSSPPKSKNHLCVLIDSGVRTLYRYFELLQEIGFKIEKDDNKRYFINTNNILEVTTFTEEETNYLAATLMTHGSNPSISKAILKKVAVRSDVLLAAELMGNAHITKIIEDINEAIMTKYQVVLKKYQSINSQTISDRLVEPISIDANYRTITAFEVGTKTNKTFVVERIKEVATTNTKFKHENKHLVVEKDVFGFSLRPDLNVFPIHIELSLKAKILLTEEYPETATYIKKKTNKEKYIFEYAANDPRPIQRFINGLPKEIKLLENHNLIGISYYY